MPDRAVVGEAERIVELLRDDPVALELVARLLLHLTRGRKPKQRKPDRRRRSSRR